MREPAKVKIVGVRPFPTQCHALRQCNQVMKYCCRFITKLLQAERNKIFYLLPNLPVDNEINEADAADISLPELANLCKFAFKSSFAFERKFAQVSFHFIQKWQSSSTEIKTGKKKKKIVWFLEILYKGQWNPRGFTIWRLNDDWRVRFQLNYGKSYSRASTKVPSELWTLVIVDVLAGCDVVLWILVVVDTSCVFYLWTQVALTNSAAKVPIKQFEGGFAPRVLSFPTSGTPVRPREKKDSQIF